MSYPVKSICPINTIIIKVNKIFFKFMLGSSANNNLHLKIVNCQVDCKYKDIDHNIQKAEASLASYTDKDELDVLILPEMAFTGYYFLDREDIKPFLEVAGKGKTFDFVSSLAKRLNSYVLCGYPELYIDPATKTEHFYNSAYLVDREGKLLLNYRKFLLYEADFIWAEKGSSFQTIKLKNSKGVEFKAAVIICMDILYDYKEPTKFEFAEFCKKENDIDAIFLLCAWLDEQPHDLEPTLVRKQVDYWINRLCHILEAKEDPTSYNRRFALVCSNRVGIEGDTTFTGCSCVVKVNPIEVMGNLDKKNEGVLLAELTL